MKKIIFLFILIITILNVSAQTQSWQWVKAGGSTSDYNTSPSPLAASCKIGGCDAKGNIYALGEIKGGSFVFDTFHCPGSYSTYNKNHVLFSYDCASHMRWAKQIGGIYGCPPTIYPGVVTDVNGNTYFSQVSLTGFKIGNTIIDATVPQNVYMYLIKMDGLGRIVWIKNYGNDTAASASFNNGRCRGMRIGSSGHLWLNCFLDSNYRLSPTLYTNKIGNYQVEVDPISGNIISGYFTSSGNRNSAYDLDPQYDMDGNENYYEVGNLSTARSGHLDTLYLNGHQFAADSSLGLGEAYIYSLTKHGNFRYFITNTAKGVTTASTCKYDLQNDMFLASFYVDSGIVFGGDTIKFNRNNYSISSNLATYFPMVYCISSNGSELWHKGVTSSNVNYSFIFQNILTPNYLANNISDGFWVYDNADTIKSGAGNCIFNCTNYYRQIERLNKDGHLTAAHTAHLGTPTISFGDHATCGATDWRGNLYIGGSITNYMVLPNGDSVANTDITSGNFFIAKIGVSDCSCPTSGVQFTQTLHGDTVHFLASSANRRDSIHWRLGDGSVITSDSFTHIYTHSGSYTVTAIAYNGCGVDSISRLVNVTTGIAEPDIQSTRVYPNPASKRIFVETSAAARMGLVAANGTSMWEQPKQVNQGGTYVFDMSSYAAGLYYFIVEYSDGKIEVLPLVKEWVTRGKKSLWCWFVLVLGPLAGFCTATKRLFGSRTHTFEL